MMMPTPEDKAEASFGRHCLAWLLKAAAIDLRTSCEGAYCMPVEMAVRGWGGVYSLPCVHAVVVRRMTSHPCEAGMEHAGWLGRWVVFFPDFRSSSMGACWWSHMGVWWCDPLCQK